MPSTKPEWNSFRPLAFLLAVAQVTSSFWWTGDGGVCSELAMWRLQKAFSNSSATHDNERVKCSDLFVGLSLKVSSRLEIWQTQTLLVAHATTNISSFTCEILTKTSTKSTWRSTKLWNSRPSPLPNEETKKKGQSRDSFSPAVVKPPWLWRTASWHPEEAAWRPATRSNGFLATGSWKSPILIVNMLAINYAELTDWLC